jgi:hypothetical protein
MPRRSRSTLPLDDRQQRRGARRSGSPSSTAGQESNLLKTLGQVVGFLGVIVTGVYLTGGIVLASRFFLVELPGQAVIGQLPREFLITVGLTNILLPAIAFGGIYTLIRLHRKPPSREPRLKGWDRASRKERQLLIITTLLWTVAFTLPAVILVELRRVFDDSFLKYLYYFATFSAIGISTFVVLTLWTRLVSPLNTKRRFHSARALALSFLLIICAIILPAVGIAAASPLLDVKICSTGGYYNAGLFIGQTKDAIYMGERVPYHGRRRILAVPLAKTEQLFLGPKSRDANCDQEPNAQSFLAISDRLGNSNLDIRVGAISALRGMAAASAESPYSGSIIRMIMSYIRGHSAWPVECETNSAKLKSIGQFGDIASRFLPELEHRSPDVEAAIRIIRESDLEAREREGVDIDLQGADLRKVVLDYADLRSSRLSEAHLELAKLYQANLYDADLDGAKLIGAVLTKADLRGASLIDADLRNADLSQASIDDRTTFEGAIANRNTEWPADYGANAAREAGVHIDDNSKSAVLVCTYFPTRK